MNRRIFIQSVAAVLSVPGKIALPLPAAAGAVSNVAAVPSEARHWAIYMSQLHGECPPHTLQTMLNISAGDAKRYVGQLVADGTIKPNPILKRAVSKLMKSDDTSLLEKVKERLELKARTTDEEPLADQKEANPADDLSLEEPDNPDGPESEQDGGELS